MVRFIKVYYSQLFSFGDYQNETIGYEVELGLGDDPESIFKLLQYRAQVQHGLNRSRDKIPDYTDESQLSLEDRLALLEDEYIMLILQLTDEHLIDGKEEGKEARIQQYDERIESLKKRKKKLLKEIKDREKEEEDETDVGVV